MTIYVIMYDPTQQICPVEAKDAEEARELIGKRLGRDVSSCPIYNADDPDDIDAIISIVGHAIHSV